jgi:hypothetical protein
MTEFRYPHQNFSLKKIKGEKWKDIPGLEGYYMVSNYARIKRLEYEMTYKNGAVYIKEERIIKPQIVEAGNKFKNDVIKSLTSRIILDGTKHNFTLTRLVYNSFVKSFDIHDKEILILCKDNDNLNIIPSNLVMATLSVRARRIIERNRFQSPFIKLLKDKEFVAKQRKKINEALSKQITQYSLKGKKIKTYASAAEAERATGIFATSIGMVAPGGGVTSGGYVWQWGNNASVDIKTIRKERKNIHRERYGQKVTQYDFNGNKIAVFPSLQHAESATGANAGAIRLVLKGMYKSAKGYFWTKGYGKDKIDLSGYAWGKKSMVIHQSKRVSQFSLDGKFIKTHPSIKAAGIAIGIHASYIAAACRGHQKSSGNFAWKYA